MKLWPKCHKLRRIFWKAIYLRSFWYSLLKYYILIYKIKRLKLNKKSIITKIRYSFHKIYSRCVPNFFNVSYFLNPFSPFWLFFCSLPIQMSFAFLFLLSICITIWNWLSLFSQKTYSARYYYHYGYNYNSEVPQYEHGSVTSSLNVKISPSEYIIKCL